MNNTVKISFKGIRADWSSLGHFTVNSPIVQSLQFLDKNTVLFQVAEQESPVDYKEECKTVFLEFYLQMVKSSNFPLEDGFEIDNANSQVKTSSHSSIETGETLSVADSDPIVLQYDQNMRLKSKEEIEKEQRIFSQQMIQKTLLESAQNRKYLTKDNRNKLLKVLQIKDPVLRYFISYSWLCELCGNQNATQKFIESTKAYNSLGGIPKRGQRTDTRTNTQVETDRFTYLRNLMGHSINDALAFSEQKTIGEVLTLNNRLTTILLEKLEEIGNGQP